MARTRSTETEARIAAAATALFCADGYVDTTVAAIAAEAGVAVQTLYLRHGSKAAILSAALDVAIAGDATPVALAQREDDFFARALAEEDLATAIRIWARGAGAICERTHGLYEVIRSAAADPEVAQVLAKNRHDRAAGHLVFAETLATRAGFAPGCSPQRAADLLYALGTEDAYLLFVTDLGWSTEEWHRWVIDTVTAQLVQRPG